MIDRDTVEKLFLAKGFALLLEEGLIGPDLVTEMRSWRHSGFSVYLGAAIQNIEDVVRVGLYIVRAPAASGRLTLADGLTLENLAKSFVGGQDEGRLLGSPGGLYDALEWIARLTSHIPDRGCQLTHYMRVYSNGHRGKQAHGGSALHSDTSPARATTEPEQD